MSVLALRALLEEDGGRARIAQLTQPHMLSNRRIHRVYRPVDAQYQWVFKWVNLAIAGCTVD